MILAIPRLFPFPLSSFRRRNCLMDTVGYWARYPVSKLHETLANIGDRLDGGGKTRGSMLGVCGATRARSTARTCLKALLYHQDYQDGPWFITCVNAAKKKDRTMLDLLSLKGFRYDVEQGSADSARLAFGFDICHCLAHRFNITCDSTLLTQSVMIISSRITLNRNPSDGKLLLHSIHPRIRQASGQFGCAVRSCHSGQAIAQPLIFQHQQVMDLQLAHPLSVFPISLSAGQ